MKRLWGQLSIRAKIVAVMVLAIILVILTIIPATAYLVRDSLLSQQQRHLANVRNLAVNLLDDYRIRITDYATLLSNDRELQTTLFYHTELAGERLHPLRAVRRLYTSFHLGSLEVGDSRGRLVATAEAPTRFDEDHTADPVVAAALEGRISAGLEPVAGGFIIKAAAPVYYDEKQLIGYLAAGIRLDDTLLRKLKELSGMEVILLDADHRVLAATLPTATGIIQPAAAQDRLTIAGQNYLAGLHPLPDSAGRLAGHLLLLQHNPLPAILLRIHATMLLLILAVLLLSLSLLFVIMKRLTRPLVRLREGAELIGQGDFSHRIEATTNDELGALALSFNRMAANLEHLRVVEEQLFGAKRLADIGEFTAGVAHEINNPIGNVLGIAKLMRRNVRDHEPLAADVDTIIREADRCGRIVQDLLAYARQVPPRREPTEVSRLLDEVIAAVGRQQRDKEIVIRQELAEPLPLVPLDPLQIGQVLRNMLLNAVQAISEAGTITVRAGLAADGTELEIAIADSGGGIEERFLERIFYPFFTTKGSGRGTGLGLAISYSIVRNHGGEILVTSRLGKGSIFRIRLPLTLEPGEAQRTSSDADYRH